MTVFVTRQYVRPSVCLSALLCVGRYAIQMDRVLLHVEIYRDAHEFRTIFCAEIFHDFMHLVSTLVYSSIVKLVNMVITYFI